jgi:hypothetical protein
LTGGTADLGSRRLPLVRRLGAAGRYVATADVLLGRGNVLRAREFLLRAARSLLRFDRAILHPSPYPIPAAIQARLIGMADAIRADVLALRATELLPLGRRHVDTDAGAP